MTNEAKNIVHRLKHSFGYGEFEKDAADLIERLEEENERLHYTLQGVMHFVDKWIDKEPRYCDIEDADGSIAVHRAAEAREIALRAIEKVERERNAAINDIEHYADCDACKKAYEEEGCPKPCRLVWRGIVLENSGGSDDNEN